MNPSTLRVFSALFPFLPISGCLRRTWHSSISERTAPRHRRRTRSARCTSSSHARYHSPLYRKCTAAVWGYIKDLPFFVGLPDIGYIVKNFKRFTAEGIPILPVDDQGRETLSGDECRGQEQ